MGREIMFQGKQGRTNKKGFKMFHLFMKKKETLNIICYSTFIIDLKVRKCFLLHKSSNTSLKLIILNNLHRLQFLEEMFPFQFNFKWFFDVQMFDKMKNWQNYHLSSVKSSIEICKRSFKLKMNQIWMSLKEVWFSRESLF